jgi:hypothetical protein
VAAWLPRLVWSSSISSSRQRHATPRERPGTRRDARSDDSVDGRHDDAQMQRWARSPTTIGEQVVRALALNNCLVASS